MSADEAVEEKSRRRRKNRDEAEEAEDMDSSGITERKGRATRSRRAIEATEETGNFITRSVAGVRGYLRGVSDELDKVVWPSREETIRLSWIVIAVTIASAAALGIIAFLFTELFVIGIREDNPIIFVIVGIAALATIYGVRWYSSREDNVNPPY